MIKKPNLEYLTFGVLGIVLGAFLVLTGTNMVYGSQVSLEFSVLAYIGIFLVWIGVFFLILAFFGKEKP
jgi:hypothetical protein